MTSFVLIPGAGGAGWYWHLVVPLLRDAGHEATAVDLPADDETTGLPEYARLAAEAAGGRDDVVLAAQSLGGFTAPLVAARIPLRALVMVNAMIPVPGEKAGQWWEATGWDEARVAAAEAGGYATDVDLAVYFLHDVPADVAAAGEPYQRPEAEAAFGSVCDFGAWPAIPIRAVAGGPVVPRTAVFIRPSHVPHADGLLAGLGCAVDDAGFVTADASGRTSVDGVWVAGNAVDPRAQVITSAGAGSAAAIAINADLVQEDVALALQARQGAEVQVSRRRAGV